MPPSGLLLVLTALLGPSAAVMMNISPRLAFVGETVSIRCELPEGITYDVARIHHDDTVFFAAVRVPAGCKSGQPKPIVRDTFAKKVETSKATNASIKINFVAQVSNSGMYVCRFIWGLNEYTSAAQKLVVGSPAYVEKLVVRPKRGAVLIGTEPMRVACLGSVGVPPGRLWIENRENKTLKVESERVTNENGKAFTKITATMLAPTNLDSETYTCRAKNIFTTNRTDAQVTDRILEMVTIFHMPHHVVISPDVDEARNGDVFTCVGRGNPIPGYKWIVNTSGVIEDIHGDTLRLNVTGDSIITCVTINHIAGDAYTGRRNLWLNSKNGTNGEVFIVHRNKTKFLNEGVETTQAPTTEVPTTTKASTTTKAATTTKPTTTTVETTPESTTFSEEEKERIEEEKKKKEEEEKKKKEEEEKKKKEEEEKKKKEEEEKKKKEEEEKKKKEEEEKKKEEEEEEKKKWLPPIFPDDKHRNSSDRLRPSPRRSVEERRYDTLLFYLKISLAANVIFGSLLLIFLIGVCVRLAGIAAK